MPECIDEYPIKVIVSVELPEASGGGKTKSVIIWQGRQQELFRKNYMQREESIATIQDNLRALKKEYNL